MAIESSTATSLSSAYYLRNFYTSNRDASSSSKRKDLSNSTLAKADADALRRAVRKLRGFHYADDTTDGANIYSSVSAFIEVYNNAMSSAGSINDSSLERYARNLKSLSNKYADELKDIGITVNSDGTLTANENLLKSADVSDVKKLFSSDSEYSNQISRYAKRMIVKAEDAIFTEQSVVSNAAKQTSAAAEAAMLVSEALTDNGIGTNINISL